MKYTDEQRIEKIIGTIEKLEEYLKNQKITEDLLKSQYSVQWAVTTPLYNIGEHCYSISKELKEKYPNIPWAKIAGLRHRLVHQYDDTNWDIICEIVFVELKQLKEHLLQIYNG